MMGFSAAHQRGLNRTRNSFFLVSIMATDSTLNVESSHKKSPAPVLWEGRASLEETERYFGPLLLMRIIVIPLGPGGRPRSARRA